MSETEAGAGDGAVDRVRRACMALPGVTEKVSHGEPTWRAGEKMFVMFADNHHGDGRIAAWCAAPLGVQEMVLRDAPEKFFRPPYVGGKGWIGVMVDRVSDDELAQVAVQAYAHVAPKKLLAQLDERGS
jgi:hypothetical protein